VSGRLLVGLRWWNEIQPDGESKWVFESLEDKTSVTRGESLVFWIPLFVAPLLWGLLALGAIFQPGYLCIVAVALAFCISNLIGYVRAAKNARSRVKSWATKQAVNVAVEQTLKQNDASV